MRFNCLLVFGYDVFGLGVCFEFSSEDRYFELQLGPLNVMAWRRFGLTVKLLGRSIREDE